MSRTDRQQYLESRHSRVRPTKITLFAFEQKLNKILRQRAFDSGMLSPGGPIYTWNYDFGDLDGQNVGTVVARDRSEARAAIKKQLGYGKKRRLPVGVKITRSSQVAKGIKSMPKVKLKPKEVDSADQPLRAEAA